MGTWPVYVWFPMYDDSPEPLSPGVEVTWGVDLVDGEAQGWPSEILVPTYVEIYVPPDDGLRRPMARTPELRARWLGSSPAGSRFNINAGLSADWFFPPDTTITGTIRRLYRVWVPTDEHGQRTSAGGRVRLVETHEIVRQLGGFTVVDGECVDGFIAMIDVSANEIIEPDAG